MNKKSTKIMRVTASKRQDPLIDLNSLETIAKLATKKARIRAFQNGSTITVARQGKVYRVYPDGKQELVRVNNSAGGFPKLEDDLCQA